MQRSAVVRRGVRNHDLICGSGSGNIRTGDGGGHANDQRRAPAAEATHSAAYKGTICDIPAVVAAQPQAERAYGCFVGARVARDSRTGGWLHTLRLAGGLRPRRQCALAAISEHLVPARSTPPRGVAPRSISAREAVDMFGDALAE